MRGANLAEVQRHSPEETLGAPLAKRSSIHVTRGLFVTSWGVRFTGLSLAIAVTPGVLGSQTTLAVNFSSSEGSVLHSASGWLYGQAEPGIPTINLMAPTRPQIAAQKPPNGLQHAGGDATQVIGDYLSAGGKQMEIYLQDEYKTFYPTYPGISSYGSVVSSAVKTLLAHPDHAHFVYDPFNEPDGQWYGTYKSGMTNLTQFESDWKYIYRTIRSIDPSAVIVGPSFYNYNATAYEKFLAYAKNNHVLPNQISWHELQKDFYSGWSSRLSSIRSIESKLGISLPIVINEYGLESGTLGVPGDLVQWIARVEAAKVYGCIAFWSPAGGLGGLAAVGVNNQATGAWWLYHWYGSMTGSTFKVTPPTSNTKGLLGLASADALRRQARIIFGGGSGTINVALSGLNSLSYFGGTVHATVWGIDATKKNSNGDGWEPSKGPYYIQEADYRVRDGSAVIRVPGARASSAYLVIVTPDKSLSNVDTAGKYEAEYADLSGTATVTFGNAGGYSGTYFVQGYGSRSETQTEFDINAARGGFFNVDLRYSSPAGNKALQLYLNGAALEKIELSATPNENSWSDVITTLYLTSGINRVTYGALPSGESDGIQLDYIYVTPHLSASTTYQATDAANTVAGIAKREKDSTAPGGTKVSHIGQAESNYLQFNSVTVRSSGRYLMLVTYVNCEAFNGKLPGPVFRFAQVSINGGPAKTVYFNNTFSWSNWTVQEIDVDLIAGDNTIRFFNSTRSPPINIDSGWAPDISQIEIDAPH